MKRALILVVPLALTLVACSGDDDDSPDVTAPDVTTADLSIPDLTLPDISLPDISRPDISLPDISLPDISLPDISLPDIDEGTADQLRDVLETTGLSDEQIDCLIEGAQEMGGEATDVSQLTDLFADCDVQATDLVSGG